jgi:hypothetical protein
MMRGASLAPLASKADRATMMPPVMIKNSRREKEEFEFV